MEYSGHVEVCSRINGLESDHWIDDLIDVGEFVDTLVIPKVNLPEEIESLEKVFTKNQLDHLDVLLTIESPKGMFAAPKIVAESAGAHSVTGLGFGKVDFQKSLGISGLPRALENFVATHVVTAAAIENLDALYPVYPEYQDLDGLQETAKRAFEFVYIDQKVIHPDQIKVINGSIESAEGVEITP